MDIQSIQKLPVNDQKLLIDYIECAPGNLNRLVKAHINDSMMNPQITNGSKITLSNNASIIKYIDKRNVTISNSYQSSFYQQEYCRLKHEIMNIPIPYMYGKKLLMLLDMPSDNYESLVKMEICISEILSEIMDDNLYNKISYIVNTMIMPFKCKGYDIFTMLDLKIDTENDVESFSKMEIITNEINTILDQPLLSFKDIHNLALLINIYYNEIGIVHLIDSKKLFMRFIGHHKYICAKLNTDNRSTEILDTIYKDSNNIQSNFDLIHRLTVDENDMKIDIPQNDGYLDGNTQNSIEKENFIFLSKDITEIHESLDDIVLNLKMLNKNTISEYIQDTKPNDIHFYLSDNAIGHVQNLIGKDIGTVLDTLEMTNKYICSYDSELYLLFRVSNVYYTIFGISLSMDKEQNRKIIKFTENKDICFKYINNI